MSQSQLREEREPNASPATNGESAQHAAINEAISEVERERKTRDRAESREVWLTLLFAILTLAFFGWQAA